MTLGNMAAFVCAKMRKPDSTSLAICKQFIAQRYELIYNNQLWKDSLYQYEGTIDPVVNLASPPSVSPDIYTGANPYGQTMAGSGIVFLPTGIDKVVAVRTNDSDVAPIDRQDLFRADLDDFSSTGSPVEFFDLPPCFAYDYRADLGIFAGAESALDLGTKLRVVWINHRNEKVTDWLTVSGAFPPGEAALPDNQQNVDSNGVAGARQIIDIAYPVTNGVIWVMLKPSAAADVTVSYFIWGLYPSQRRADRRIPLRFVRIPTVATPYKALVKLAPSPLVDDLDSPSLLTVDNVLIAFAQSDMLERERQYGKAGLLKQEAIGLLEQFTRSERAQRAGIQKLSPEVREQSGGSAETQSTKGFW